MRSTAEAFALGLLHGPAELLPISSSAHVALIGADVDQVLAVAVHAGTALALLDQTRLRPAILGPASAIPALAALALEEAAERRLGSPRAMAAGMLAGAAALALADRTGQTRTEAGWRDAGALGLAQAAALWPGVSRNGATLSAARARGLERGAANRLSREVGVPLLLGAAAFKARRVRPGAREAAGAAGALVGTLASRPLLRLMDSGRPLWPFAVYRVGVALALLRRSRP